MLRLAAEKQPTSCPGEQEILIVYFDHISAFGNRKAEQSVIQRHVKLQIHLLDSIFISIGVVGNDPDNGKRVSGDGQVDF